jgi:hypothetical protein
MLSSVQKNILKPLKLRMAREEHKQSRSGQPGVVANSKQCGKYLCRELRLSAYSGGQST